MSIVPLVGNRTVAGYELTRFFVRWYRRMTALLQRARLAGMHHLSSLRIEIKPEGDKIVIRLSGQNGLRRSRQSLFAILSNKVLRVPRTCRLEIPRSMCTWDKIALHSMSRLLISRIVLLAVIGTIAQSVIPPAYSQTADTAEAQKLLDQGQFDDALRRLDVLAARQPEAAGTERLRGMAFYNKGQMQSAEQAFAKAVAQDPSDREAMQMEGVALFRMGKSLAAIPFLEKANLAIPSSNIDNNYVLGLCYLDARRYDDARHAFASQYHFPPDSPSAYLLAARMMLRRDYLPTAETTAQKALALNPNLPMAHLVLGQIRLARSQFPEAIAEFEAERTLNPLFGEVYDRLGDTYIRSGDYVKAQEALDQAVLLEPTSPVPFILLGKVLLKQRDLIMAQQYLQKAVAIDEHSYIAHALLGQTYRSLGRTGDASHEFQLAEEIQAAAQPKIESPK